MITAEELANAIVRDVAELPDRNSPEGWPEAMIVTADELRLIVQSRAAGVRGAAYDRELIATMLHEGASVQKFTADAIREQIRLLRAADNADAAGVRTVSRPPKDAGAMAVMEVSRRNKDGSWSEFEPCDYWRAVKHSGSPDLKFRTSHAKDAGAVPLDWNACHPASMAHFEALEKDAGAAPIPDRPALPLRINRETLTAPGKWTTQEAEVIRAYGNAREDAGRADAVPLLDASFAAFDEITGLCSNLRQGGPAPEDLESLSSTLELAIDIAANMMAKISKPPAEPAARAQVAVGDADIFEAYKSWPDDIRKKLSVHDLRRMGGWAPKSAAIPSAHKWVADNGAAVTGEWLSGWDACRVAYPRANPSPAHAGSGAEALSESVLMEYARRKGWPVTLNKSVPAGDGTWYHHWDITIPTHELAKFFPAHRLAGGDHA